MYITEWRHNLSSEGLVDYNIRPIKLMKLSELPENVLVLRFGEVVLTVTLGCTCAGSIVYNKAHILPN